MYEVRDGNRVLRFDGDLLSQSSSRQRGNYRWVEFELYRTKSASYVLGRIGQTRLYHALDCAIVQRNRLKPTGSEFLTEESVPCDECLPADASGAVEDLDDIAIEKPRFFALVSDSPEAILEALYKYDPAGARYLTKVAERLIEDACTQDARLEKAYRVEYIL